jgi:hypothetical protein
LQPPWVVDDVRLDTAKRRIDFEIGCHTSRLACPACGAATQPVHDRLRRSWRHLDFFQFEAWLHCDVPRVACGACGKTTQVAVPWARPGSGFTAAFEALALTCAWSCRCARPPTAALQDKRLWRRIEFYVEQARALEDFSGVRTVGIDETSLRRGQHYITVVHDLDPSGCCSPPRGATTDGGGVRRGSEGAWRRSRPGAARVHGHERGLRQGRGAGAAQGADQLRPLSRRAMAIEAMDQVRRAEMATDAQAVRAALGAGQRARSAAVGHARNPGSWSARRSRRCTGCSARRSKRAGVAAEDGAARGLRAAQRTTASSRPHPTSGPG